MSHPVPFFECPICGYHFCSRGSLATHLKRTKRCRPKSQWRFPCAWCERGFDAPDSYRRHRTKCHPDQQEAPDPRECVTCHGVFSDWFLWRAHMYRKHRLKWVE